ncbi:MAG: 4-hydroxy-tetrahydrodipicolinate synthase [Bacteroidota bacterium]
MEQFMGTGVALVTPFDENQEIDFTALEEVVEHCIQGGVDYLVALGTTAETATLDAQEKQQVARAIREINRNRKPLVLGIGGNNTRLVCQQVQNTDLAGYDGILSVSPYYSKPTQEGIFQHFGAVAGVSPLPIIMYNVPSRTGSNMLPDTVVRLARTQSNIIGLKEACGDMVQVSELIRNKPEGFMVISGDDFTALPTVLAGGAGVISVLGQGVPNAFSEMIRLGLQNATAEAYAIHHQLSPLMRMIFEEGNPAGIKTVLAQQSLMHAGVRLPLIQASENLTQRISGFMEQHFAVDLAS